MCFWFFWGVLKHVVEQWSAVDSWGGLALSLLQKPGFKTFLRPDYITPQDMLSPITLVLGLGFRVFEKEPPGTKRFHNDPSCSETRALQNL